jgi:hypothetical protein
MKSTMMAALATPMSRDNFQPTVLHFDADLGARVVTQLIGET